MKRNNRGITLIALVITIIVLLILATNSIATLTGQNGILDKASEAGRQTDIKDTKEQIKIELMGMLDETRNNYTNSDVIEAVEKITGEKIAENTAVVQSRKGNEVDILDLWMSQKMINFTVDYIFDGDKKSTKEFTAKERRNVV